MALEKTETILLQAYNWAESSRTIVFFSKELGKIALVDKGGRSIKSKRGRIMPFSIMELTFYDTKKDSPGYISDIEILKSYSFEKDGSLGRLAYASAATELLKLLLPEEAPQQQLYNYLKTYLEFMNSVGKKFIPALFVAFYLRILTQLGYHPSIAYCTGCNKDMNEESSDQAKLFASNLGGIVCGTCQKPGEYYISLSPDCYKIFAALQTASLSEAATVPISLNQATILQDALSRFVSGQTQMDCKLKSLAFIEKLKNSKS